MKKIYSFVLMAAMLLIGTNVKADTFTDAAEFLGAWDEVANGDEFVLGAPIAITDEPLVLNLDGNVTLDLGGKTLTMNVASNPAILVKKGVLTIKNGTIKNANVKSIDLIRVVGTTATGYDAENGNVYSQVIVESNATIDNTVTSGSTKFNAMTITEVASATPYSNGARIDLKGTIKATTYGIKVNGTIQKPAQVVNAPYVHIHGTANITAGNNNKAVAAYAAGYAHWLIEGTCEGATGVYVKSGDVDIHGATISSNFAGTYDPVDNVSSKSGVTGAGSAVAVESNQNYSGSIDVTVDGGSTLTAGTGYALEENVSNNAGNVSATDVKVEAVTVEDATFNKGTSGAGAITISQTTTDVAVAAAQDTQAKDIIVVTSATIDGNITFGGATTGNDDHAVTLNDLVTTSAYFPQEGNQPAVVVPLDVTLTADGYASFSAPVNLYKKSGSTFAIYTGAVSGEVLELTEVNFIKKDQGVILKGANNYKCEFTTNDDGSTDTYGTNQLKPSTLWASQVNKDHIYCLRNAGDGTMLYRYTGDDMPANKAYLDLNGVGSFAPHRIQMVIAETQAVENVEVEAVKAVKFIENGQVLIKRGENIYNVQGQIVK